MTEQRRGGRARQDEMRSGCQSAAQRFTESFRVGQGMTRLPSGAALALRSARDGRGRDPSTPIVRIFETPLPSLAKASRERRATSSAAHRARGYA